MAIIVEPPPGAYESEWRYQFGAETPDGPHVVFSGSCETLEVKGTKDDFFEQYEIHLLVGPFWGSVVSVVPQVVPHWVSNDNADEDDEQGFTVSGLTWDAVSGTGPNVNEERIRLKFFADVKGENSKMFRFGYFVFARGRELGQGGVKEPSPVHPNP